MKKPVFMLVLIMILICSFSWITITAYADIPNIIISGPESEQGTANEISTADNGQSGNKADSPSEKDLVTIGSGIEYPRETEYLNEYSYGVVQAPGGHSVYCYGSADMNGSKYTVADGEEVEILARRGQMLCIIIPSQNKARWIREANVMITENGISQEDDLDNEGNETWVRIYSLRDYGDTLTETEYSYNQDEMIVSQITHTINRDGTEYFTETNNFVDADGKIVSSETRDSSTDDILETELWYYTAEQELEKICTYDWSGILKAEQNNRYYDDKKAIEYIRYDDNGDQISRYITIIDTNGNQVCTESYNEFNELTSKTESVYDLNNEKEKEIAFDATANILYIKEFTYLYDRDGLPAEATGVYTDGKYYEGRKDVCRYSYDKYGNLTQETYFYDGKQNYQVSYRWGLLKNGNIIQTAE